MRECLRESPPSRLMALVDQLTQQDAARRPPDAATALALLERVAKRSTDETRRGPTTGTQQLPPAGPRRLTGATSLAPGDRRVGRRTRFATAKVLFGLAVVIALVAAIATMAGGGGGDPASRPAAPAPPDAPPERQLDALERAVRDAQAR